jgi:hypothetical protein
MADEVIRPKNTAILVKLETTPGTDAAPVAADAITFEDGGYSYNYPYGSESSNENTGSYVAGAPLQVGQPADLSIQFRMKGAAATYTASVKPPHHALLSACGKRGLFTAAVAAAALAAGTTTSATLGTGFAATAQLYRGMPLLLTGAPAAGARSFITDYTVGKVATLVDQFGSALSAANNASIPANWTYAGTSPRDAAGRATDHPAATIYIYEDGTLLKFVGCRGSLSFNGDAAKPGFATAKLTGIFAGTVDAAVPSGIVLPTQGAPTVVKGVGGVSNAVQMARLALPFSKWSLNDQQKLESPIDGNTDYGFSIGQIGGREPVIGIDPLKTLVATRDTLASLAAQSQFTGVIRSSGAAFNRWGLTFPLAMMQDAAPGTRGELKTEDINYRAVSSGQDANTRDGDWILCFD